MTTSLFRRRDVVLVLPTFLVGFVVFLLWGWIHAQNRLQNRILNTLRNCPKSSSPQSCFEDHLTQMLKGADAAAILNELQSVVGHQGAFSSECHTMTHVLGRMIARHNESLATMLGGDVYACNSGFQHGVLEEIIGQKGQGIIDNVDEICSIQSTSTNFSINVACAHGVGHALLLVTNQNLFKAINLCKRFSSAPMKASCYEGVFMENVVEFREAAGTLPVKAYESSHNLCLLFREPLELQSCWAVQPILFAHLFGSDYRAGFKACDVASQREYTDACYTRMGYQFIYEKLWREKPFQICSFGDAQHLYACALGVSRLFIRYGQDFDYAVKFCREADRPVKSACYYQLGEELLLRYSKKSARDFFCNQTETEYRVFCYRGSGSNP